MARKKIPNIAARFGARYGATLRKRWNLIMYKKTRKYDCPQCGKKRVKWVSIGLWRCRSCGYTFAGGAWEPVIVRRK